MSSFFFLHILMFSWWFKTKARSRFWHPLLLKPSRVRGKRNKKAWFRDNSFYFQIFQIFSNLERNFGLNLNTFFWWIIKSFGVTLFFVKILTHYKTDLKHAVAVPLHQWYCVTCLCSCIKLYCPKMRGSWVIGA